MAKDNPFNLYNNDSSNPSSFQAHQQNVSKFTNDIKDIEDSIQQYLQDLSKLVQSRVAAEQNYNKLLQTANNYYNSLPSGPLSKSAQLALQAYINQLNGRAKTLNDTTKDINQVQQTLQQLKGSLDQNKSDLEQAKKDYYKNKQTKVFQDINSQFQDTKLTRVFYKKFMDKNSRELTTQGKVVGAGMSAVLQNQDRFIRKLVLSLGQLPIFQKVGRSLIQLGGIVALHGASKLFGKDQTLRGRFSGLMEILGGGLLALMPVLGTAFGHIAGEMLVQLLGRKLLAKAFINLLKGGKIVQGASTVAKGAQTATTAGKVAGTVSSLSGFGKIGALFGKFVPFFTKVLGPLAGLVSIIHGAVNLFSGKGKVTDWGYLISGIALVLAPFFGPTAPIVAGVAGILQGITTIIDNWKSIKSRLKELWPFGKDKIKNDGGSGKNYTISPSYNKVGVTNVDKAIKWQNAGKMQTFTNAEGTWDYYRFGGSPDNMGQGYWLEPEFNSKAWSKEQLNNFAKRGMYNLEALQGGNGVQIANTFYNDAMAGRKGSNILLQTAAARMKQMGHGDLILTSALASATSGHAKGYFGHSGGQTFDFSAKGLSKEQAIQYAKDLKSTGLFSHTQAEYNRKTGEWHIDARFSDQAYNELNKQAQKANEDKRPINQTVAEQKKPINQMVAEQKKQQPAQIEFDNVINNSLAISKGIFEKANYR